MLEALVDTAKAGDSRAPLIPDTIPIRELLWGSRLAVGGTGWPRVMASLANRVCCTVRAAGGTGQQQQRQQWQDKSSSSKVRKSVHQVWCQGSAAARAALLCCFEKKQGCLGRTGGSPERV